MLEVAIVSRYRQLRVGLHRALELRQVVLGNTEINRDRLQLRDHHETGRIGRMNDIAGVHQAQTDPAGDRRSNTAVNELKLGVIDSALIALDRAGVLSDQRLLVVEVLARDDFLVVEFFVAGVKNFVVFEVRQIFRERPLSLRELHLIWTRIDLSQQIAGLYYLPFGKIYPVELPIHPAFDRDRVVRRHGSDRGYVLLQIAEP